MDAELFRSGVPVFMASSFNLQQVSLRKERNSRRQLTKDRDGHVGVMFGCRNLLLLVVFWVGQSINSIVVMAGWRKALVA
jgi:hypothetical protein